MKRTLLAVAITLASAALVAAQQERPVPKDSSRVSIPGCARNRSFIVGRAPEGEPVRSDIEPGRRFKMNGAKPTLSDIKAHERMLIEVTGLVRRADLDPPRGIGIGSRVRIGGGQPVSPVGGSATSSAYAEAIIDVESWRPLPGDCPQR
jgi:hypothetical protein